MAVNFVCVWTGTKYDRRYVEVWQDMVLRNSTNVDLRLWCLTDKPDQVPEGMVAVPAPHGLPGWWAKVYLFSASMPFEDGERIVYLDLDVAITGRLEDLVERPGIIRDFHWPCYNSSAMVWDHGDHAQIWTSFTPERMARAANPKLAHLLPAGELNGGDQEHITEVSSWDVFPAEWFRSYRDCKAWPPSECKAVVFHGQPKPHEIADGWVPNIWTIGGYTSLPELKGVNTTHEQIKANIVSACERDLPWFTGFGPTGKRCLIVGGAPSLKACLPDIRWHARMGAQVVAINNAWRPLVRAGIKPAVVVMCDARPENAEFVQDAPEGVRYLIASQCHPDVFDALKDREVVVWHVGFGDNAILKEALEPWWDEGPNQRPCVLVPGGGTGALRALWLANFSGFRTIHMYGVDSSYADDGQHHAYAQPLNDGERIMEAVLRGQDGVEKRYRAAPWMLRQVEEFKQTWADLKKEGVRIHVHGAGLLPDVAAVLKAEEKAA